MRADLDALKQVFSSAGFNTLVIKNAIRISGANAPRLVNKVIKLK